jgi:hypothetical protein
MKSPQDAAMKSDPPMKMFAQISHESRQGVPIEPVQRSIGLDGSGWLKELRMSMY